MLINTQEEATSAPQERNYSGVQKAYFGGTMKPEHVELYKQSIASGEMPRPEIPKGVYEAYISGKMKAEHMAKFEQTVNDGIWSMPEIAQPEPLERTMVADVQRQGELTVRAVASGLEQTLGVLYNPIAVLMNQALNDESQIPMLGDRVGKFLTKAGFAQPETMTEEIVQRVGAAVAGAGGTAALGRGMANATSGIANTVAEGFAIAPGSQMTGAAAGEVAGVAAQAAGAGPAGQFAANMVGGAVGGSYVPKSGRAKLSKPPALKPEQIKGSPDNIGALTRKASTSNRKSLQELAEAADVNIDDAQAADRLNIDLPPDVFSDVPMVREAAGLTRSKPGSVESGVWREVLDNAFVKADEIIGELSNNKSIAEVSDDVKKSLTKTHGQLNAKSKTIYAKVDNAIPKNTPVEPDNIIKFLNGKISDLGGESGLSGAEKKLFNIATDPDQKLTYARLLREKGYIGKALARSESPYGSMLEADLNQLYDALRLDQLATVKRVGGKELGNELAQANAVYTQKKDLEKTIVNAFGKDGNGSIADMLTSAVKTGGKGNVKKLNDVIKIVPKELQREALLTAVGTATRTKNGNFGFSQYSDFYKSLKRNRPIYDKLFEVVGKDSQKIMHDLAVVSDRITKARANVLTTGKANQDLVSRMVAENIIAQIIKSSTTQKVVRGGAAAAGAATTGPVGAMGGSVIADALLSLGKKDHVAAAGKVFSSEEFKRLAVEAAVLPKVSPKTIEAVSKSRVFLNWAKKVSIEEPNRWLMGVVTPSKENQDNNN